MFGGLFITLTIILGATIYAASITEWSGQSKFWFAIFGPQAGGQSLQLGIPFVIGILLTIVGIVILWREYIDPRTTKTDTDDSSKSTPLPHDWRRQLNEKEGRHTVSEEEKRFIRQDYIANGHINEIYPTPIKNHFLLDVDGDPQLVVIKNNLALRVTEAQLNKQPELKKWFEETV